jgi:hypothetical protein
VPKRKRKQDPEQMLRREVKRWYEWKEGDREQAGGE